MLIKVLPRPWLQGARRKQLNLRLRGLMPSFPRMVPPSPRVWPRLPASCRKLAILRSKGLAFHPKLF